MLLTSCVDSSETSRNQFCQRNSERQRGGQEDDENVTYEWSRFNAQKPMIKSVVRCCDE